jgi:hypothetical protein
MCRFSWDEAKYPVMAPIREIVNTIQESVAKLDIDFKVLLPSLALILKKSYPSYLLRIATQ